VTSEFGKAKANFSIQIIENASEVTVKKIWQNINKLTRKQPKQETKGLELKINNQLVRDPVVLASGELSPLGAPGEQSFGGPCIYRSQYLISHNEILHTRDEQKSLSFFHANVNYLFTN
jgi:hypothetical protein